VERATRPFRSATRRPERRMTPHFSNGITREKRFSFPSGPDTSGDGTGQWPVLPNYFENTP
jgi:hypothetical protein